MARRNTDLRRFALIGLAASAILAGAPPAKAADETPWWDQGKIRFFWGQWSRFELWKKDLTPQQNYQAAVDGEADLFRMFRTLGTTVFVDHGCFTTQLPGEYPWGVHAEGGPNHRPGMTPHYFRRGALAKQIGLTYFAGLKVCNNRRPAERVGARLAVNRHGRTSLEEVARGMKIRFGTHVPCPLDEKTLEEWLRKPALMCAESGVVDGMHIDWESYGATGFDQMGEHLCYCDTCFGDFSSAAGFNESVPSANRYDWLKERGVHRDYLRNRRDAVSALYRDVAEQVRKIRPDFVFSAYGGGFDPGEWELCWRSEGAALGLHSPSAPFIVVDASHYNPHVSVPWWETGYWRVKKLGMKYILGAWTGALFGNLPAMEINAAQWMYEAAMSHDGYWVWYENRFGPSDVTAFRTAEKRIAAVENRAGELLTEGVEEHAFLCLVEQSGSPDLAKKIQQRTRKLDDRYLVWVFNANSEHSVDVLLRFPRLLKDREWSVTDLLSGLRYTHSDQDTWSSADLAGELLLVLAKRSGTWLVIEPYDSVPSGAGTIAADVIDIHPDRPTIGDATPLGSEPTHGFPVVYTRQNQRDFYRGSSGESINHISGTSLHLIDASAKTPQDRRLLDVDGYCRSPALSPDGGRVAFSEWVNGKGQIFVANVDGAQPRNISSNDFCDTSPTWSGDGRRIAFLSDRSGSWQLHVMNDDGSNQRQLTDAPGNVRDPAWSPAGESIAFVNNREADFNLYVIDAASGEERVLVDVSGNVYEPVWSPNGKGIACTVGKRSSRDILVFDALAGKIKHHLLGLAYSIRGWWAYNHVHSIAWSPDSLRIAGAFERSGGWHPSTKGTAGVFVADLGSGTAKGAAGEVEPATLKELIVVEPFKPKPGGSIARYKLVGGWYWSGDGSRHWLTRKFDLVRWSPDGKAISFRSDMDPSGYDFLYTIPSSGGEALRLDDSLSPMGDRNAPIPLGPGTK
jgi:hypothetical protein